MAAGGRLAAVAQFIADVAREGPGRVRAESVDPRRLTPCRGIFRGVFGVTVRLMSDGELSRLEVLRDLDQRRLKAAAAAQLRRGSKGRSGPRRRDQRDARLFKVG